MNGGNCLLYERANRQSIGGEDDRRMDPDSVGRGADTLGRSGASMSAVGAVVLIFTVIAGVLIAAAEPRRKA